LAGFQIKLGCNVAQLVLLGSFNGIRGLGKISAGIVHILIKEQLIEFIGKIVVMMDMDPRRLCRVALVQLAHELQAAIQKPLQGMPSQVPAIHHAECQKIAYGSLLDGQRAIHISFARMQLRV
jgi:hypothetical protein